MSKDHAPLSRKEEEEKAAAEQQNNSGLISGKLNSTYNKWLNKYSPLGSGSMFKKKSKVSQPGDASEIQADAVAKAVTEGNATAAQVELQNDVNSSEITVKASDVSIETPPGFEELLSKMQGGGLPLPDDKKEHLEEMLGTDLDHVRLHTGSEAVSLADEINARAFATGDDVFFADSMNDEELLAHEVAHVVQGGDGFAAKIFKAGKEIELTDNVGVGMKNIAGDVIKIQYAFYKLGYAIPMNEWTLARETQSDSPVLKPIPGTVAVITEFQILNFPNLESDKTGWMGKSGQTLRKLNESLILLDSGVGIVPSEKQDLVKNYANDVKKIQDALTLLGYAIPENEKPTQDQLNSNAVIDQSNLVNTGEYIKDFQKNNIPGLKEANQSTFLYADKGQTLNKINQQVAQKDKASTFKTTGRVIALKQPVGKGQKNRAEDVRSIQIVLILLGYVINQTEIVKEETLPDTLIAEIDLTSTIKAIRDFQTDHFGPKEDNYSKYGWVGIEGGQTLKTINNLVVILEGPVGNVKHQNANMSRDVLSVQEALRQIGYSISDSETPIDLQLQSNEIIETGLLTETIKAITGFQEANFNDIVLKGYLMPDGASVKKLNLLLNEKTKIVIVADTEDNTETQIDDKPTVTETIPKVVITNTIESEGVGDDLDSDVDVNEKLEKFESADHQEPTTDYLNQVKKNRDNDFTSTVDYLNADLRAYTMKGAVGESSGSTANHKDDLVKIQDAIVNLGYMKSTDAENERPTKLINDDKKKKTPVYNYDDKTTYFNKGSIKKTIAGIKKFQSKARVDKMANSATKKKQLQDMGMNASPEYQSGIIINKDASYTVLTNISRFTVTYTDYAGKSVNYSLRNFVYSAYNKAKLKDSYMDSGKIKPDVVNFPANDLQLFTDTGLTDTQAKAMMWVSANEGGFDALNTYDDQLISVGYAQLAGRFSFEKYVAMIKYREPELFKTYFLNYGIDVEFKIVNSKTGISDDSVKLYVYDPDSKTQDGKMKVDVLGTKESDDDAKKYIVSHPVLLAAFNKAIQDPRIKKVMIELTVRSYAFPAQDKTASLPITNYVQVTENTTGKNSKVTKKVINEYFDTDAVNFIKNDSVDPIAKKKYSELKTADRISEPDNAEVRIGDIIRSELGLAQLYDWAVHLNYPRAVKIMAAGIKGYAATKGYSKKSDYIAIDEHEVLKWLKNSFGKGWDDYSLTDAKSRLEKLLKPATSDGAKKAGRVFEYHNLSGSK